MVQEGELDQPGIGFAFVMPVERAVGMIAADEMARR
jgi:hypothetical protein